MSYHNPSPKSVEIISSRLNIKLNFLYSIAAQIAFPERQSIAFVGNAGLTMLMGEFATAVQYNLPIKVIVIKNNTLGMIRWEQMGFLGNPEFGVEFSPIDFAFHKLNSLKLVGARDMS